MQSITAKSDAHKIAMQELERLKLIQSGPAGRLGFYVRNIRTEAQARKELGREKCS